MVDLIKTAGTLEFSPWTWKEELIATTFFSVELIWLKGCKCALFMDEEASLAALTLGSSRVLSLAAPLKVKPTVDFFPCRGRYLSLSISQPYKRFVRTMYCGTQDLIRILQRFVCSLIFFLLSFSIFFLGAFSPPWLAVGYKWDNKCMP